jgi:hypothetical protein
LQARSTLNTIDIDMFIAEVCLLIRLVEAYIHSSAKPIPEHDLALRARLWANPVGIIL